MIKYKNKAGYTVYSVTSEECFSWGGFSICDDCGTLCPSGGYLVPVLNHFMCPSCFQEWNDSCKFYPEDSDFEFSICHYYEGILHCVPSNRVL